MNNSPYFYEHTYFKAIDPLRYIAFLMVFLVHAIQSFMYEATLPPKLFFFIFNTCNIGLIFLFMVSGFLIIYSFLKEQNKADRLFIKNYYIRRILRIHPLYFLIIILTFYLIPLIDWENTLLNQHYLDLSNSNLLYYLFFIGNFDLINQLSLNQHFSLFLVVHWSLCVEEQFYLLAPWLINFLKSYALVFAFSIIILVSIIFRMLHYDAHFIVLHVHTLSIISDIAIGGLLAYGVAYHQGFIQFFKNLKRKTIFIIYLFLMLFVLIESWIGAYVFRNMIWIGIERVIQGLIVAFIFLEQSFAQNSFIKVTQFRFITIQGKYIYGLYLFHTIGLFLAIQILYSFNLFGLSKILVLPIFLSLALLITSILSYYSYSYWEMPFLKLKNRVKAKRFMGE